MKVESHIGKRFHGIRIEVTDKEHNSGYNILKVYGYGYKHIGEKEIYLGEYDVVQLEQKNASDISIDSTKVNSEFEIRIGDKSFEVTWNCDSIRFKIINFDEVKQ